MMRPLRLSPQTLRIPDHLTTPTSEKVLIKYLISVFMKIVRIFEFHDMGAHTFRSQKERLRRRFATFALNELYLSTAVLLNILEPQTLSVDRSRPLFRP